MSKRTEKGKIGVIDKEGSEGQEEEDHRQCIVCGEVPESIICLACEHTIAIPCAAKVILRDQNFKELDISKIVCPVCGEITYLSEEVQVAIVEFLQNEDIEFDVNNVEGGEENGEEENGEGFEEEEGEAEEEMAEAPQLRPRTGETPKGIEREQSEQQSKVSQKGNKSIRYF
jgi:hypothetical protein